MKSIGIDIGSCSIKVAEVVANNKGQVRVTQFIEHPLNINPAFDPEIQILEFLRNLAKAYDPGSTRFTLGLRQDQVSVRFKSFPFSDRLKINKSLPFELEEDLPFSAETAIFDAKIVKTLGPSAEVLACASPKRRIEELRERFGDIGFEISTLSTEGIALANTLENWFESPPAFPAPILQMEGEANSERHIELLVSIGHTRTIVTALEQGRAVGVRSILWGGKQVAEAVARRYEIPFVEALKEVQSKAFILPNKEGASYDQIVFSDTIAHQFKDLSRDLKISILEIKSELNAVVDSVQITGGSSQVLHLQAFLTQMLELPVNTAHLLDRFAVSGFEKSPHNESIIGVALGLAIEGLKKPRNPAIQFLRGEFAQQNAHFKKFFEIWGPTLRFAGAFYLAFFVFSSLRENVALSLSDRATEALKTQGVAVAKLSKKSSGEAGINKYIKSQKKRAQELKTLSGLTHMNSALDILKKVNDALPTKTAATLNVKKFYVEDTKVIIEGTVSPSTSSQLIKNSLTPLASDHKVEARSASLGVPPTGTANFAFSFKVDRGVK